MSNTEKKKRMADYTVDHENQSIIVKMEFYEKAKKAGTSEGRTLLDLKKVYTDYTIKPHHTKGTPKKLRISYSFIEKYLEVAETKENYPAVKAEYDKLRRDGKAWVNATAYNVVRAWFLKKYPSVKNYSADTFKKFKETGTINAEVASEPKDESASEPKCA